MDKKMNNKAKIYLMLSIATMIMIFIFSQQDGNQSSGLTVFVVDLIKRIFNLGGGVSGGAFTILGIPIRKVAHMTVYGVLGFNVSGFLYNRGLSAEEDDSGASKKAGMKGVRRQILLSLIWCLAYAISDEIHQSFIPGRACQLRDVGYDMCGAVLTVGFYYTIIHRRENKSKKPTKKQELTRENSK